MNTTFLMLLVFLAAVVLSWLLTRRVVARWKRTLEATETLLLGVCVFGIVFFLVGGLSIAGAYVYRQFARQVGSAISETAEVIEEARRREASGGQRVGQPADTAISPVKDLPDKPTGVAPAPVASATGEADAGAAIAPSEHADSEANDMLPEPTQPAPAYVEGSSLTGKPVGFGAGDGFVFELEDGTTIAVRLAGIDAPERGQSYWNSSRKRLSERVYQKTIKVVSCATTEKSDAVLGLAYVGEDCVNTWMVREGCAWYAPTTYESEALAEAQEHARREKRGLWSHPDPLTPAQWREVCNLGESEHLSRTEVYGMEYKLIGVEDASVPRARFVRKLYRVVVPTTVSESYLRAILLTVHAVFIQHDPDIDAIIVLAFEEQKGRVVDFTPIGMLGWAPDGKWDNVSAEIGKTNDRSSYKYYIEISEAFREKQGDKSPPE